MPPTQLGESERAGPWRILFSAPLQGSTGTTYRFGPGGNPLLTRGVWPLVRRAQSGYRDSLFGIHFYPVS